MQHVVYLGNSLPQEVVEADGMTWFKKRLKINLCMMDLLVTIEQNGLEMPEKASQTKNGGCQGGY